MKRYVKWIFPALAILFVVFFLLRGCMPTPKEIVKTVHDTTYVKHTDTITVDREKLVYVKSEKVPIASLPKKYIPNEHPDTLVRQYGELLTEHTTKHMYLDTLKIDSIGWVAIKDTVQFNGLTGRTYSYNIKERQTNTTTTITKTLKPKNQFFVGVEAAAGVNSFDNVGLGLLLKNRKDNILGVGVGYDIQQKGVIYSVKYYGKLHL